jgi:hypothetical protein
MRHFNTLSTNRIFKLELPLTITLFNLITKWWDMNQVDGPNRIFYGFPLRFKTRSLATSMYDEYFLLEMIFDFLVYYIVVAIFAKLFMHKNVEVKTWITSSLYIIGCVFILVSNFLFFVGDFDVYIKFNDDGYTISKQSTGLSWFYSHAY